MNQVAIHNCDGKNRKSHKPEIKEEFKTLREAMGRGKQLAYNLKRHAFVNWYIGKGWCYQIIYKSGGFLEVRKYSTRK